MSTIHDIFPEFFSKLDLVINIPEHIYTTEVREKFNTCTEAIIVLSSINMDKAYLRGCLSRFRLDGDEIVAAFEGQTETSISIAKSRFNQKIQLAKQIFKNFSDYEKFTKL
ncbi:hypothetical protein HZS_2757 [Henneguya salminicola]|nr:hypothetical protein HZS_2757 [Henneguya salminicola]